MAASFAVLSFLNIVRLEAAKFFFNFMFNYCYAIAIARFFLFEYNSEHSSLRGIKRELIMIICMDTSSNLPLNTEVKCKAGEKWYLLILQLIPFFHYTL